MRTELVYDALLQVRDRYRLCRVAATAAEKMHRPNSRIQDTVNDVLLLLGDRRAAERTSREADGGLLDCVRRRLSKDKKPARTRVLRLDANDREPGMPVKGPRAQTAAPTIGADLPADLHKNAAEVCLC